MRKFILINLLLILIFGPLTIFGQSTIVPFKKKNGSGGDDFYCKGKIVNSIDNRFYEFPNIRIFSNHGINSEESPISCQETFIATVSTNGEIIDSILVNLSDLVYIGFNEGYSSDDCLLGQFIYELEIELSGRFYFEDLCSFPAGKGALKIEYGFNLLIEDQIVSLFNSSCIDVCDSLVLGQDPFVILHQETINNGCCSKFNDPPLGGQSDTRLVYLNGVKSNVFDNLIPRSILENEIKLIDFWGKEIEVQFSNKNILIQLNHGLYTFIWIEDQQYKYFKFEI